MKVTRFVGQLLSPAVERDALALLGDRCPDKGTWPEGTTFSEDGATVSTTTPHGPLIRSVIGGQGMFKAGEREIEWFVRVSLDGLVSASDEITGDKVDGGRLTRPLVTFFADWKDCDANVMANDTYAMALWYADDLATWHDAEAARLRGRASA